MLSAILRFICGWALPSLAITAFIGVIIYFCYRFSKDEDRVKGMTDILSVMLLFLCAIGILFAVKSWFKSQNHKHEEICISLTASIDTSSFAANQFSFYSDSLIRVIDKHEQLLNDKYSTLINEKENSQKTQSIIGILISVIVAIVGFFGYTNIKSIEKKAISLASDKVDKEVCKYLDNNLRGIIRDSLKSNFSEYMDEKVANRIASQVKGEVIQKIIDETESKIQEDIVRYFTINVQEKNEGETEVNNPFIKG